MPILQREGAQLNYDMQGNGPPVVFIQGVGVIGKGWQPQVEKLARDYSCLTFDNRGIGQSSTASKPLSIEQMATDTLALMDAMNWDRAHIVGHSMGGVIAQQLALDAPHRVQSLALLCTFARGKSAARLTARILAFSLRTRIGTRTMRRRAFLEMIFSPRFRNAAPTDPLAAQLAPLIGRDLADNPPILMQQLHALGRHDIRAQLGQLSSLPTLVVSAEQDPIALPEYGRDLANCISGARYVELKGVSHGVPIEDAPQINLLLCEHFSTATG